MRLLAVLALVLFSLTCLPTEPRPRCSPGVQDYRTSFYGDSSVQVLLDVGLSEGCSAVKLQVSRGRIVPELLRGENTVHRVRWQFHNDTGRFVVTAAGIDIWYGQGPFGQGR